MKKQIVRTLLMLSLFVIAGVANAQAQVRNEIRAQIPCTFTMNNRVFPAGEYSFERTPTGSSRVGRKQLGYPSKGTHHLLNGAGVNFR